MISIISSIYDPLGFVAPYTLKGTKLLQQICRWESKLVWMKEHQTKLLRNDRCSVIPYKTWTLMK